VKKIKIAFLLLLCGCSVGPNYKAPENTVSNKWASGLENSDAIVTNWWEVFGDELLTKYIKTAAEYNNDLLTATSNIAQARALKMIVASAFFPKFGADINATRTYFSKNGPVLAGSDILGVDSNPSTLPFNLQAPQLQSLFNAVLDAKWEIDIWGKTRRGVEAANAYIEQTIEERNDVLISVMAEIASNYIELRGSQTKEKLISEYIELLESEYELIHKQYEVGYVNLLDVENIRATLAKEKAKLPEMEAQIRKNIYTISVLTGSVPEVLVEELLIPKKLPKIPETIAVGLRSDLLRRRPDVRKVERMLAEATAEIGVAVASFFPSLVFMGDIGFQSLSLSNLFSMGSKTWSGGGDFNLPIFQGGKLVGNLKAKRAKTESVAHSYQQTILNALQETESAVNRYGQDLQIIKDKTEAKNRYEDLVFLSKERYTKGLVNLLQLIDSERACNQSKQDLLASDVKTLLDTIFLYKALGGGWETPL
jgi:multidrug efflux system outer membrane protein